MTTQTTAAWQRGFDQLCRLEGTDRPSIIDNLREVAPALADLAIRFAYGELYPRTQLDLRSRQLVTVAALAALGTARAQLKFHVAGALNVGCTPTEIIELMIHLVVYAGFPAGLNGLFAAQEVFGERGIAAPASSRSGLAVQDDAPPTRGGKGSAKPVAEEGARYRSGWQALSRIDGHAGEQVIAALADIAPDLGRFIIEFAFGDVYTRSGLDLVRRELVTVAALAAMGTATPQLKVHIHGLLNVGGTREELIEALTHLAAYAGFPAAINGVLAAREVLDERAKASADGDAGAPGGPLAPLASGGSATPVARPRPVDGGRHDIVA